MIKYGIKFLKTVIKTKNNQKKKKQNNNYIIKFIKVARFFESNVVWTLSSK